MSELDLAALAREHLGVDRLRPGQQDALEAVLDGHDVLGVMPTGYGKSAIYQAATTVLDGTAVVISPLIALQRDQVDAIQDLSLGDAETVNSAMSTSARDTGLERVRRGDVAFVFLAPEQLGREDTVEALREAGIVLFVVDEAHCISSWGHDFRPDYLRLGALIDELGHPRVLALTATASPPVQDEIVERLHLRHPAVVVTGFDRPNLHLAVERHHHAEDKDHALVARTGELSSGHHSGIVYAATRARTEAIADALQDLGVRSGAYHAGLPKRRRDELQTAFMDGDLDVMVATTAFGMGVDKPDVRFVVHADVPESVDSYYQEIGRAGRDGAPAEALLFYRPEDLGLRRFLSGGSAVGDDTLRDLTEAVLEADEDELTTSGLAETTELSERRTTVGLSRLEDVGAVRVDADGTVHARAGADDVTPLTEAAVQAEEERRQREASRLEMMRDYAESTSCRRRALLTYFGERFDGACGTCDNCERDGVAPGYDDDGDGDQRDDRRRDRPGGTPAAAFPPQQRVTHDAWGDGRVLRVDDDVITVLFDSVGYKTLSLELVQEGELLRKADE